MTNPPLRIGTRASALARWQAERVRDLLAARGVAAELVAITTSGDEGARPRPAGVPGKGTFTKEIEDALLGGRVDLAVHSLKDLWVEPPAGLVLAAVPEREDPRDALVGPPGVGLADLPPGARIGTSSLRRRYALLAARPDLEVVTLRGNVPTRVRRVDDGTVHAAVLALAGLRRLGLAGRALALHPDIVLPAAGQGAIAIEARDGDRATLNAVLPLESRDLRLAVDAERAALAALGAGCNVPIGALCEAAHGDQVLTVAVYASDGRSPMVARVAVRGDPVAAGREAAAELRRQGADGR
jgi:hydroxymethylbilane synthase